MGYQNLKSEKVEVLNYPGAISSDIIDKTIDVLDAKPESLKVLVVHVAIKKIVTKTKKNNFIKLFKHNNLQR